MVLLLIVSGDVNVEPSKKNGYRRKSRDQTAIFLRKRLRFVFAIVKSMSGNLVKVNYGGGKKEHEFSFMCIIISMVEPLFYLTQTSAIGIGNSDFFPMLRMNQYQINKRLSGYAMFRFGILYIFFLLYALQPIFPNEVT
jgi:hypothetical protein